MVSNDSDEALFVRYCADADPHAFSIIFERTAPHLARVVHRHGVRPDEVDDVVQDTYLAAFVGAAGFDPSQKLIEWLCGIARKKAVDIHRRRARRRGRLPLPRDGVAEEPIASLEAAELRAAVSASMRRVPERYREVLRLYYEQRMTAERIARELGRAPSTVRTQISRGVAWLRDDLPRGLTPAVLGALALPGLLRAAPVTVQVPPVRAVPRALPRAPLLAAAAATLVLAPLLVLALSGGGAGPAPALVGAEGPDTFARAPRDGSTSARPGSEGRVPARRDVPDEVVAADRHDGAAATRAVRVRVVLEDGKPVVGVGLGLQSIPGEVPATLPAPPTTPLAVTGPGGIADFAGVPPGPVRVRFADGHTSEVKEVDKVGGIQTLEVMVERVSIIEGNVRDPAGHPVEGAEILGRNTLGMLHPGQTMTTSGPDGSFRVVAVDVPRMILWARAMSATPALSECVRVELEPAVDLAFVLQPAPGVLHGNVWSPEGRPASDVLVRILPAGQPIKRVSPTCASTDSDGAFEVRALRLGTYVVSATRADGCSVERRVEVSAAPEPVSLTLVQGARLSGRITLGPGQDPAGLIVVTARLGLPFAFLRSSVRLAELDSDGSFVVPSMPAGETAFVVMDVSSLGALAQDRRTVGAGEAIEWFPDVAGVVGRPTDFSALVQSMVRAARPTDHHRDPNLPAPGTAPEPAGAPERR